ADAAGPPSPAHRRGGADGMADSVRLHETRPGRGRHRPMEAGDRRPVTRAYGGASGDRDGRRRPRAQSHVGAGTPELRPPRLILTRGRGQCGRTLDPCTTLTERAAEAA